MSAISEAAVLAALRTVQEPELGGDLVTRNMVKDLHIDGADVAFTIELTIALARELAAKWQQHMDEFTKIATADVVGAATTNRTASGAKEKKPRE